MHPRLLKLLAVLFSFALVAAACGGDDDDDGSASADGTEDATADDGGGDDDDSAGDDGADESTDDGAETDGAADDGSGDDGAPEEERTASDIGVTEDTVRIGVLVSDLDGLRSIGFPLPEALTNDHLIDRFRKSFERWNEAGGINGRMIETVPLFWDPIDPATQQDACTTATLDEELFMVINSSGFSSPFLDCFTVDNDMLFIYGEIASLEQIARAPERLFTVNPPAEVAGSIGTQLLIDDGVIAEGDTVGIVTVPQGAIKAASDTATQILEDNGITVVSVEVNTLSDDNAAINAESAAAVSAFDAEGVDHALVMIPFTQAAGFWGEVGDTGPTWGRTIMDTASSTCTPFGASRTDPSAEGSSCVTAYDSYSLPDGGIREDSAFEAACRETWLVDFGDQFDGASDPGVPSGDIITTADGEMLYSDYALADCTIIPVIEHALTNGGVNPTRDSVAAAIRTYSGDMAQRSNGFGSYGPDKNYLSDSMHSVRFTIVPADTPRGEDGTFLGCPAPTNCWQKVSDTWLEVS